jgi:predicted nucleotidyltransferase
VRSVLARNGVGEHNLPVIFGSRASGEARRYSDLDIGFAGEPVPSDALARIEEDLEESDLPIHVDVLNLAPASQQLREHALSAAVPLHLAIGPAA